MLDHIVTNIHLKLHYSFFSRKRIKVQQLKEKQSIREQFESYTNCLVNLYLLRASRRFPACDCARAVELLMSFVGGKITCYLLKRPWMIQCKYFGTETYVLLCLRRQWSRPPTLTTTHRTLTAAVSDTEQMKGYKISFSTITASLENTIIEKAVVSKQVVNRHKLLNIRFI